MSVRNAVLGGVALATIATGALHYLDAEPVVTFLVAAVALAGLAWVISVATESVGVRFGPAVTGALQSTLGNLPELFIVLFALSAGELVVAQTSIVGSLLANALLVLGLAIVAGSRAAPDGVMRFKKRLPNDTATLLLLAVFIIVILGLSDTVGDRASRHEVAISAIGAVFILAVYGVWLWSYLRSDEPLEPAHQGEARPDLPFRPAVALLAAAGVCRGARLRLVRRRPRPRRRRARYLQGVHGAGDRRDRGERRGERRRASRWRPRARATWRSR